MATRWLTLMGCSVLLAACTKRNPAVCCATVEECEDVGFDEITGCELELTCVEGQCVERMCERDADCPASDPVCDDGVCTQAPPDAEPRILYLAFSSDRDGDGEIYRMNPDGGNATNLTSDPANDSTPKWDPNGERIAFISSREGDEQLYVMTPDGGNVTNISHGDVNTFSWSPDGSSIAFVSERGGTSSVYVASADGTGLSESVVAGTQASWSPDGTRLVVVQSLSLISIDADGSNATTLDSESSGTASWITNESVIYSRRITFANRDVYRTDVVEPNPEALTNTDATELELALSRDRAHLVGSVGVDDVYDIFTMEVTGANYRKLTNSAEQERGPCWSPDNLLIAFTRDGGANGDDVYVVGRDGGNPTNLTDAAGTDGQCDWRPQ